MIRDLARQQSDQAIAATLNRAGVRTGRDNSWTQARVCSFRRAHGIAVYRPGEMAERGELTLEEAAERLGVSKMTVLRLIGSGAVTARQVCKGAPWAVPAAQLEILDPRVPSARPITAIPGQATLDFQ
jgi:excisionase family DNA binding protein